MSRTGVFHFSLDTVLKVREIREEQARIALSRAIQDRERTARAMRESELRRYQILKLLGRDRAGIRSAEEFRLLKAYLEHLDMAIDGLRKRLANQDREVADNRTQLSQRHQEHRLLTNLRTRYLRRWRQEMLRTWEKETEAMILTHRQGK